MNVDVFDVFEQSPQGSTGAPNRERDNDRRSRRALLALIIALVTLAAVGVGTLTLSRGGAPAADPACDSADLTDQRTMSAWLQERLAAGLSGRERDVRPSGCTGADAGQHVGVVAAVVDEEELAAITHAIGERSCDLPQEQVPASCSVELDGLQAELTAERAPADSPLGEFQITMIRDDATAS